jgi:hypothetical protein
LPGAQSGARDALEALDPRTATRRSRFADGFLFSARSINTAETMERVKPPNFPSLLTTDSNVDVWPAFGAGGRLHFGPNLALTVRAGFPVSAVGISLFF